MNELVEQLCDLTKRWNDFEDVPVSQRKECRKIGVALNAEGGMNAMRKAYYEAKGRNPSVHVIQAYWDGIGDWVW